MAGVCSVEAKGSPTEDAEPRMGDGATDPAEVELIRM